MPKPGDGFHIFLHWSCCSCYGLRFMV
ncbi:hypothetical protein OESDEN_06574 [Oesophagostomum dentatum]|uniref:Uncharacterized protein n=1 Tax=Oesophagostomum dentatum TaxID=61180 RepID=A0A0B1T7G6_OESDE|nr:hypothetical protein OESDEN_06574 [Oesophagostomum dentatum]